MRLRLDTKRHQLRFKTRADKRQYAVTCPKVVSILFSPISEEHQLTAICFVVACLVDKTRNKEWFAHAPWPSRLRCAL